MKYWNTDLSKAPNNGETFYTYHPYIPSIAQEAILKTRNIGGYLELTPKIDGYEKENYKIYAWAPHDIDVKSTDVINELDKVHHEIGTDRHKEVQKLCKYIEGL